MLDAQPPETVTVAVQAVGLNFADVWTVLGFYKAANNEVGDAAGGLVPGIEFAGRLLADSPSGKYVKGTAVFGFTRFGGFSTHITVPETFVRPLPEGWSFEEGAAFLVQALTAWHGLQLADLDDRMEEYRENLRRYKAAATVAAAAAAAATASSGSRSTSSSASLGPAPLPPAVCIHSAAGGVGLAAWEICRRRGARLVGTVGSESKKQWLLDHLNGKGEAARGAAVVLPEQVVVRPPRGGSRVLGELLVAAVRHTEKHVGSSSSSSSSSDSGACGGDASGSLGGGDISGRGGNDKGGDNRSGLLDIVLDGIGGPAFEASLAALNKGGRVVHFGGSTFNARRGDRPNYLHMVPRFLTRPRVDPGSLVSDSKGVLGFNLIFLTDRAARLNRELDELLACLSAGEGNRDGDDSSGEREGAAAVAPVLEIPPPHVGRVFPFEDAPGALRYLQSGESVGKVVLRVAPLKLKLKHETKDKDLVG